MKTVFAISFLSLNVVRNWPLSLYLVKVSISGKSADKEGPNILGVKAQADLSP